MKKLLSSGTLFIWICGLGVAASLLMVFGLLFLIMINGLGFFWPKDLVELTLKDGTTVLGEIHEREIIPHSISPELPEGKGRLLIKIGNRDLYGLDFRWVDEQDIISRAKPPDAVMLERREWGNFYGRVSRILRGDRIVASGTEASWQVLPQLIERANALQEEIQHVEKDLIGDLNYQIEQARLAIRAHELKGERDSPEIAALKRDIAHYEQIYQQYVAKLQALTDQLDDYAVVMQDTSGQETIIPIGLIIKALRPNEMDVMEKCLMYLANVWALLSEEPREANTEGGIFPAIVGTVMMVLMMSIAAVPFGVIAAVYLKEYAHQGWVVRMVRIAVNNLAGIPSIVFGVFGLGFFVYTVGGTIDQLWYPEALPNPTFGTGGILWASLTLALLTVPVVIVATEEGLASVPQEYREGSLALGATKFESILRVILPCALPGILTGFILAVARATGEVAPLMLTGVVKLAPSLPIDSHFPFLHLDRKFMHLGFHIYDMGFQSPNVEAAKPMVYVTTLVLVTVVVTLNLTAITLRNYMRKRMKGAAV
ncbi:MAG: phosphate ABC transporter permease PstA [Nitrospirae bacterium]|nr:MAG: phosphate ABC transporter permease PstA [Nitrospirota bacterium]